MEFHDIDKLFTLVYHILKKFVVFHENRGYNMIITFLGHAHISMNDRIKETVKAQIRSLLTGKPITCYLGGYGDFDDICARACKELKQKYDIETVYVTPYVTLSEQEKIKEMQR